MQEVMHTSSVPSDCGPPVDGPGVDPGKKLKFEYGNCILEADIVDIGSDYRSLSMHNVSLDGAMAEDL